MQEFQIGKNMKLCFLIKKHTTEIGKDIVIPYDNLADIDKKRFFDMEKQGGELMRVMRDTTLDNGVNALLMYADMLVEVALPPVVGEKKVAEKDAPEVKTEVTSPVRKSRGRPAGSKNKVKS